MINPPYIVFFEEFPTIHFDGLVSYINNFDPQPDEPFAAEPLDEIPDPKVLEQVRARHGQDVRLQAALMRQGDFSGFLLTVDRPSDDLICLDAARLPDAAHERLAAHRCHAVLEFIGGEHDHPIESIIFPLKIVTALCRQSAVGFGNEFSLVAFDDQSLQTITDQYKRDIWRGMRDSGDPRELYVNLFTADWRGRHWCMTAGHGLIGLPEFAAIFESDEELGAIEDIFMDGFYHLFESGPLIQPGDEVIWCGQKLRVESPPSGGNGFFQREGGLIVLTPIA